MEELSSTVSTPTTSGETESRFLKPNVFSEGKMMQAAEERKGEDPAAAAGMIGKGAVLEGKGKAKNPHIVTLGQQNDYRCGRDTTTYVACYCSSLRFRALATFFFQGKGPNRHLLALFL